MEVVFDLPSQSSPMANAGDADCSGCLQHKSLHALSAWWCAAADGELQGLHQLETLSFFTVFPLVRVVCKVLSKNYTQGSFCLLCFPPTQVLRWLYPLGIVIMVFLSLNRLTTYLKSRRHWCRLDPVLNWQRWKYRITLKQRFWQWCIFTCCQSNLYVSKNLLGSENHLASRVWPGNVWVKNPLKWELEFLMTKQHLSWLKQEYQLKTFVTSMTFIFWLSLLCRGCFKCRNSLHLSLERVLYTLVVLETTQISLRLFWDWFWCDLKRSAAVDYPSKRNPAVLLKHPAGMKENKKLVVLTDAWKDHEVMRSHACGTGSIRRPWCLWDWCFTPSRCFWPFVYHGLS